jgi:hypothetical protein
VSGNQYEGSFVLSDLYVRYIHAYCSYPGYHMRYFTNTKFEGDPIIDRIERNLPQIASHFELRTLNYFTLDMEWFATFDVAETETLTVALYFAEFSNVEVLVDDV